jgi:photosystem II stability/assembly factor-like uncharacterized protein
MKNSIKSLLLFVFIYITSTSNTNAQNANCLTTDGVNVYAGYYNHVLKLSDKGNAKTFSIPTQQWYNTIQINSLAINGSIMVAVSNSTKLFISSDSGINWVQTHSVDTDSIKYIDAIATDGSTIFIGANSALYVSNDKGLSWKKNNEITNANIFSIKIIGNTIYAGGNLAGQKNSEQEPEKPAFYVSNNKGINWKRMDTGLKETVAEIVLQDTTLFAGTLALGDSQGALFRFNKKESNWKALKTGSVASLAVSGKNVLSVIGDEGVLSSDDKGEHWLSKNNGLRRSKNFFNISNLTICDSTIYGISNGYVYLSTDNGENWVQSSQTKQRKKEEQSYYSFDDFIPNCIVGTGTHAFAGGEWGVYEMIVNSNKKIDVYDNKYFDGTNTNTIQGDGKYDIQVITLNGNGIYAQGIWTKGPDLLESYDNGVTWVNTISMRTTTYGEINIGENYWYSTHSYLLNVSTKKNKPKTLITALIRNGNFIYAGTDKGIYRLTKGEDQVKKYGDYTEWTCNKIDLQSDSITSIVLNGSLIYVGTKDGLFVTIDNGDTYTAVDLNKPKCYIYSMASYGTNIYAGTLGGVFISNDNGKTWSYKTDGLDENLIVRSLAISGSTVYAKMQNSIYVSFDNGNTWEQAQFNKIFKYPNLKNKQYYQDIADWKAWQLKLSKANSGSTYQNDGTGFHSSGSKSTYNPNPTPSQVRMYGSQNAHNH